MTEENEQGREPFYWLEHRRVRGKYVLVAKKIGKSGNSIDIVAQNPVTNIDPVGSSTTFRAGSTFVHSGIEFNISQLEDAISQVSERATTAPGEGINAFSTGLDRQGGFAELRVESNQYVIPVEFYHIEVNANINYLRGRK